MRAKLLAAWLAAAGATLSCGPSLYVMSVSRAEQAMDEATRLGADQSAPYEFYYALEHLKKARSEALEGDYGAAVRLSKIAQNSARRSIRAQLDRTSSVAAPP